MHWSHMLESELRTYLKDKGYPAYRGTQLFEALHHHHKGKEEITNLPKDLLGDLEDLKEELKIEYVLSSQIDETKKMIYRLWDGEIIEGVLMKYQHGYSLCVSTQVGCLMGCSFCASTVNGKARDLSAYEIASQVYRVEDYFDISISNIILMGSGEPLDNYEAVIRALRLLHEERGQYMSYRNMTLSTCGLVPGILSLAREDLPITLAISLHYTDQELRAHYMPIGKRYPLDELRQALEDYYQKTRQRITIEYTLIEGINDKIEDIKGLEDFVRHFHSHINVIPLNPVDSFAGDRPERRHVEDFAKALQKKGLNATIRRELGRDIAASCGQLKAAYSLDE
ncbi:MAG: 23S rRNA (adenine(2503)-C(2))-methyltransferase RlmN [Tissierellia bacterium]|nr:23S rRNA (adenine(2503)-C(2))-methyltransferase RlmN [Tissierellia bacterium]